MQLNRLLPLLLLLASLASGWYALDRFSDASRRAAWKRTEGVVLSSTVIGQRAFRPNVVYEYLVAGIPFRDSSFLEMASFGGRNSRRTTATVLSSQFQPGDSISVFVNPTNPRETTLSTRPHWSAFGALAVSSLLLIGAGFLFFLPLRK